MSDSKQPLVICLVGPTAAGKTDIAVDLVRRFPCEIISVDSAMVYRHMDVGSAKPDAATLGVAPHHLIDIRDPWESYSAGQFCTEARRLIDEIHARSCIPLLVGGTFLYFHALQFGLAPLPSASLAQRPSSQSKGSLRHALRRCCSSGPQHSALAPAGQHRRSCVTGQTHQKCLSVSA